MKIDLKIKKQIGSLLNNFFNDKKYMNSKILFKESKMEIRI
jgi:hypothetical protein